MADLETRLDDLERKVEGLMEVVAATADDTLRVCFVLDELCREGRLPPLPWDVATALVELHHATQAMKSAMVDGGGTLASQRVEELKAEVSTLRETWQKFVGGA
jgi:uncharacterized protein YceH (UPF0502 family)